jgi:tetratricopeptide (TPR) repeat protein
MLRGVPFAWIAAIAVLAVTPSPGGLAAAAAASGRPRECAAKAGGPTLWQAARLPGLTRYCDLVAEAQAEITSSPALARERAREADALLPGHAAPAALLGRAALALGELDEAARRFEDARATDPHATFDPPTLHDLATVLRRTGRRADALATYRTLVPRVDLLATADRRALVLLEAAWAAMDVDADAPEAARRGRLDEAMAYLAEARRRPPTAWTGDVLFALAIALDRSGDRAGSDGVLADAARSRRAPSANAARYVTRAEDAIAVGAIAAEQGDRADAAKAWEAWLATSAGRGPWAASGRARLEALRKAAVAPKHKGSRR